MKRIPVSYFEKWSLYFISAVMALGTVNPFALSHSTRDQETQSFLIYPALIFVIISFISDKKTLYFKSKIIWQNTLLLFSLWIIIVLSDIIYGFNHILVTEYNLFFFVRLLFCFFSFYILTILFIHTRKLEECLLIFSIIMVILFLPFLLKIQAFSSNFMISNGRLWMYGENPNTFSARMSIAIIFFSNCILQKKFNLYVRITFVIFVFILTFGVLLSGSRGSLAIVTLSFCYLIFKDLKTSKLILIGIPSIILGIILLINFIDLDTFSIFNRFEKLADNDNPREVFMVQAIDIWKDHPIIGSGYDGYQNEKLILFREVKDSHCIVTSILAMGGILGVMCFLTFISGLLRYQYKIIKRSAIPFILSVFMFFVSLKTGGIIAYFFMYYIYSWCMAYSYLIQNKNIVQ